MNFMQQNASGGRYIKSMGVQGIVVKIRCIVVKYQDALWVESEYFVSFLPISCPLGLLPCSLASGSLAWPFFWEKGCKRNWFFFSVTLHFLFAGSFSSRTLGALYRLGFLFSHWWHHRKFYEHERIMGCFISLLIWVHCRLTSQLSSSLSLHLER